MRKISLLLAFAAFSTLASAQCTRLFFSEYLEGASNNKAIEIYNPTTSTVNLADYVMYRYNNGSLTPSDSLHIPGTLAPGGVYVAGNPSAIAAITSVSDTLHTITFYNGDDAMSLKHIPSNTVVDIIGIIGVDPGTNWVVGSGATSEFTLVRMAAITGGTTNWAVGATEWDVYPQNTTTFIGSHTGNSCAPIVNPVISFSAASSNIGEAGGTTQVTVNISHPNGNPTSVTLSATGASTANNPADYTPGATLPVTITWPANDSTPYVLTLNIVDDAITEGAETIVLDLTGATNSATISGSTTHTVTITDNDIPTYTIGQIHTEDGSGVADSTGVTCWLHGVVYGVNLRPAGLQFTLIDPTGGIAVFSSSSNFGYTVLEGDSIKVRGSITQFNGLTEMVPDSLVYFSGNHPLVTPAVVTALGENTESQLVQMNCVHLVDAAQWTGAGSGFNVDVTDGTNTIQIRIDADVDLYTQPAPTGMFNVVGLGGQFDASTPFDAGYQLMPRYIADIANTPTVDLGPDVEICDGDIATLDAGTFDSYAWCSGQTSQTITASTAGSYCVEVTNSDGCVSADTINVSIEPAPTASFTFADNLLVVNFTDGSSDATSWAWDFGDSGTSTSQNPSHTYSGDGTYTVTLIASNACGSDTTTQTITVTGTGIASAQGISVVAFPNPSNGEFTVRINSNSSAQAFVSFSDLAGRVLLSQELNLAGNQAEAQISTGLAAGSYLLRVTQGGKVQTLRITIK